MTAVALAIRNGIGQSIVLPRGRMPWRLVAVLALAALVVSDAEIRRIVLAALSEAYLQVSVFVAATLAIFYALESWLGLDTDHLLRRYRRWQVPVAAFLGALPGCGGAVMVMTQYAAGKTGFGAVVAVLTATMGDAAFLLLAREPLTGLAIFALGLVVGILSGTVVDALHGPDFLRLTGRNSNATCRRAAPAERTIALRGPWLALMVPGLIFGVLLAFQVDPGALLGPWSGTLDVTLVVGAAGALLAIVMWCLMPEAGPTLGAPAPIRGRRASTIGRVIADTNFVTIWVIVAFLVYELGVHVTGADLAAWFDVWAPIVPLIGVLVGLLPGCGPQVVVTTLYLSGVAPLSAQVGNAISNDGDALFPAMAISPRAAVIATLYSAVPAIIVAYGYYWLWE